MASNPLRPLPADRFDLAAARHLAARAGFGATPAEARALRDLGLDRAVAAYVSPSLAAVAPTPNWDRSLMRPPTPEEIRVEREARVRGDEATIERIQRERQRREMLDRRQIDEMRSWWMDRFIASSRPLEEKMTLFFHSHFATGYRTVENSWYLFRQNDLFRSEALGRFDRLVRGAIRDPALLKYLDNDRNRRQSPNENLARELLELFTLGEGRGYGERDIKEGARALTGYTFEGDEFRFRADQHDDGGKTIFGKSGRFDGDDFVGLILARRETSEFLCSKLYRFFVSDAPGPLPPDGAAFVTALAREFRAAKYDLAPVLTVIFRSAQFYGPGARGAIVKSPVQLIVQAIRSLGTPRRSLPALVGASDLLGQHLFQPPNVKGWEGGRAWINTASLFVRQNILIYLLTGRGNERHGWIDDGEHYDATHLVEDLREAGGREALADPRLVATTLLAHALATPPHPDRVAALAAFLASTEGAPLNDRLVAALALVTALPEYQLA